MTKIAALSGYLLLLASLLVHLQHLPQATGQVMMSQMQVQAAQDNTRQQFEIAIKPNEAARIECRLPPQATNRTQQRQFYWNFQRTSIHDRKPDLLCYGTDCSNAASYGLELDYDQASGTYDLLIGNATFELNDGVYYCDYRDSSPEAGRLTINREIRLTILIPPGPPTIGAVSASPAREGQEHQLSCQTPGGNPEPNVTWFKNEQQISPGAGLRLEQSRQNGTTTNTLTWIPTIDDHQAVYKCAVTNKAMSSVMPYERALTLQVEYAPRIAVGPHQPLRVVQGERATLSCQVDANPPVKGIRWLRDGHQLISNQYNHTLGRVEVSDAGVYSCQADNGIAPAAVVLASGVAAASGPGSAGASPTSFFSFLGLSGPSSSAASGNDLASRTLVEARLQLEVLYAPRVYIRESQAQPLNENDYFVLNCSVESWPPAHEFVWTKQEDAQTFRRLSSSSSPSLEFPRVSASDLGNYTCTAFNRLEPSSGQVYERSSSASHMVLVRHKPGVAEITLGQGGETELGNKTQIQCRARPPGYPEPKFNFWKWQTSNSGERKKYFLNKNTASNQDFSTYTIFSARPEDEGSYGCVVANSLGNSTEASGSLVVNEAPTISDDKTWRGEDFRPPGLVPYQITVRASGKPEPKVSWFHRSPVDGRRVELSSAEMASRFRIETQSKAEPLTRAQQHHHAAAQFQNSNPVAGGQSQAPPRARYMVVSTLVFKNPLEVDDRGLYTVEFSNGLSRTASVSHQLHINHTPVPAPRNMPIVIPASHQLTGTSSATQAGGASANNNNNKQGQQQQQQVAVVTKTRAGFNLGETVNLTCRVSAHPKPQFVWYSQASGDMEKSLENNSRYRTSIANPIDDIWEGSLTFDLASELDYGDYMCVTANQDYQTQLVSDSIRIIIQLGHKTAPEPPAQIEQVEATQDSVTLQWVPGFDGGFALNQFLVQYAPDDAAGQALMRRFGSLASSSSNNNNNNNNNLMALDSPDSLQASESQQQQFPKLYDCLSMNPCTINNLQPRQAYLMRLRARNELGFSDFSDELRVSTRANVTQIPRIQEAHFDSSRNILHFRVEPNPEYLLNNLEARIDVRSYPTASMAQSQANQISTSDQQQASYATALDQPQVVANQEAANAAGEWRRHSSVPIRHEQGEAYLNMAPDVEALRLTLCSRTNESLCGQEFVVGTSAAATSFLQDQRGLSMSIFVSVLFLIAVITLMASQLHSRCLSRKAKKAAALDRVDHHHHHHSSSLSASSNHRQNGKAGGHVNGGLSLTNGSAAAGGANGASKVGSGGSHGSTASTNSTSATNGLAGGGGGGGAHQLASMENMHGQAHLLLGKAQAGSNSDHSSDHSRQAKLDSMLPPNYSHYADRASLMLEQQQQQAYLQEKLGSPFGLPAGALMGEPQVGDYFGNYTGQAQLEHQQMIEAAGANSMVLNQMGYDEQQQQQQQQLYASHHHPQHLVDDYNYNSALAYQNQSEQQIIESAYGTTGGPAHGLMMAQPTQASYDNSANQSYLSYPQPQQQQQHQGEFDQQPESASPQYHQDLAAAQQQMYGTLTRHTSLSQGHNNNSSPTGNNNNNTNGQEYATNAAGLMPPPPLPPPQESDYGTTGGARTGGRLIREIIV